MLIDAHTHVTFKDFKDETADVVQRSLDASVWMVTVGTQIDTSRAAVELANNYPEGVYAAVGLHPEHTYKHAGGEEGHEFQTREEAFDSAVYKQLALDPKTVAIGECGLDYYWFKEGEDVEQIKELQRSAFNEQIKLAAEVDKVLMIHCRPTKGSMDAYEETLTIMAAVKAEHPSLRFQVHCYTGTLECAQQFVDLGGYISLSGIITFDKTGNSEAVVRGLPLDRLLTETDAPYLAPAPHRGKRNEPLLVEQVARKIAEWTGLSYEEVAEQTAKNARTLFKI